jgi:outer membrane biosynthesis protein TonB
MVNKEKALKQELIRLRRNQNPQQLDFRRMRKIRIAKAKLSSFKRKATVPTVEEPVEEVKEKKAKPKKKEKEPELEVIAEKPKSEKKTKPKKKAKEPELEVIEDKPKSEEISSDLEGLYTYDEDIDEEDAE